MNSNEFVGWGGSPSPAGVDDLSYSHPPLDYNGAGARSTPLCLHCNRFVAIGEKKNILNCVHSEDCPGVERRRVEVAKEIKDHRPLTTTRYIYGCLASETYPYFFGFRGYRRRELSGLVVSPHLFTTINNSGGRFLFQTVSPPMPVITTGGFRRFGPSFSTLEELTTIGFGDDLDRSIP